MKFSPPEEFIFKKKINLLSLVQGLPKCFERQQLDAQFINNYLNIINPMNLELMRLRINSLNNQLIVYHSFLSEVL